MMLTKVLGPAVVLFAGYGSASLQIVSGGTWTAAGTNQHIQAHGGAILEIDSVYYWIARWVAYPFSDRTRKDGTDNIRKDLVQWTFENELLTLQDSGDLGPDRVVERPKVIYNEETSTYVLWLHIDDSSYGEAKTGVATSSSVCGTYTYQESFQPLGYESRDIGLFKDDDGTAYLLTEDRENGLRIDQLSSDYTQVDSEVYVWGESIESPAIYKQDGVYFMFGSQLTGWDTNDNQYSTATSLGGPWSEWATFADEGSNTYDSQTTFVFAVGDTVMYMGDRWLPDNLMASTYIWLPFTISGTTATLKNQVNWILSPSGNWSAGPSESNPEAESATFSNGAEVVSCDGCSASEAVGYLGGTDGGTLEFSGITSSETTKTTIRIKHLNGDSSQRYATVSVNGESQVVAFLPSSDGQTPASSSLHAELNAGSENTIVISAHEDGWAPDVDRLMVPES
ncbi:hypothetical protein FQN54_005398 [Arachnomyces sp. PD_36]|nr:hypothetical protein FQN54_005398 [Arachnomyces sp. PD_36]